MRKVLGISLSACVIVAGCTGAGSSELRTFADSASYAVGMNMGSVPDVVRDRLDRSLVLEGVEDALAGGEMALSQEDAMRVFQQFVTEVREADMESQTDLAEQNRSEGENYREQNAQRSEVTTTESGLQYEVLREGSGPRPAATDEVTVHYKGTLIDGTVFDSSYDRDEPATFTLNGVIPGWTEGVQLMPVGSKYRFVIPPELGYGARGAGPDIGPNSTLVFEVELLEIGG